MKRFFSIVRDVAFVIFVIAICGMIFIMSTGKHFTVGGYQVLRVLTSSMEPAIAENTCIIIKEYPVEQLKVGDIITFTSDDPQIQGYYNTHRIHDIVEENGEILYVTKGDATSDIDAYPVHQDQVAGIYVKELPGGRTLGKCFLALSDNKVYFLVIMLPLTLCLLSYFWQIVGLVTGRYDEDEEEEDDDTEEEEDEEDGESSDADGYVAEPKDTDGDGGVAEPKDTDGDGGVAEPKDTDEMGNNALCEGGYAAESENVDEKEENAFDEVGDVDESGNRDADFEVETISDVEKNAEFSDNNIEEHDNVAENLILDSAIEKLLAEAASKIEKTVNSEKERIDKIVEELTTTSVSDEAVEEMRAKLKEKYKKMNIKNS